MRIGLISGIFPPDIGGPASYVPSMASRLTERGHSVAVLCLSDNVRGGLDSERAYPVHRIRRGMLLPLRVLYTTIRIFFLALRSDVLYVNGLHFEAWIAASISRVPVVHKIVGDYAWERARNKGLFNGTIDDFQSSAKNGLLRFMSWARTTPLKYADAIIVPSQYLGRIVTGWGIPRETVRVIYNAARSSAGGGKAEKEAQVMATVCRLVPWKGVDRLIGILPEFPAMRLEIAGDGPLRAELENLTASLGVSDRVVFHGNVSENRVKEILRRATIFVLNSSYEGLPHVVLEAMREETPVIATDVGGTSEVVEHEVTGLLIRAGAEDELRTSLRRLLGNPDFRASLVENATLSLQGKFSYEFMIAGTESILSDTAASRPGKPTSEHATF